MFKKWSNRDWFWLISIFLGIIIIILTWRLNDNDSVVNIISMFSSGASIILALVAIVQSTMYNNSASELNARITEKISVMESNVELIKNNLIQDVKRVIDDSPIDQDVKAEIKNNLNSVIREKDFIQHPNISSIIYERLIVNRLKNICSSEYSIKYEAEDFNCGADIVLENQSRIVLIEIKVLSQPTKNYLIKISKKLKTMIESKSNLDNKLLSGIIIIISDTKINYPEEIDERISVVQFTNREMMEVSDDIIKKKLMI